MGDVKKEGWAALGKVAELHERETNRRTFNVVSRREHMLGADREDLRKIWEAMWGGMWGNKWFVTGWKRRWPVNEDDGMFCKEEGDEEWNRLMEVLDISQEEWDAKFVPVQGQHEEDESSDKEDSDEEDDDGESPLEAQEDFSGDQD